MRKQLLRGAKVLKADHVRRVSYVFDKEPQPFAIPCDSPPKIVLGVIARGAVPGDYVLHALNRFLTSIEGPRQLGFDIFLEPAAGEWPG